MERELSLGGYIPTPLLLKARRSLLNIKNRDDNCFLYCLAAAYHTPKSNKTRPKYYNTIIPRFNLKGKSAYTVMNYEFEND